MTVHEASPGELAALMNVLDGANIAISPETVSRRIEDDMVLLVGDRRRPLGVLVAIPRRNGAHVEAIAVRRRRRGQGIGRALVDGAAARWGRLTATFDPPVLDFYTSLSFDVESRGERYWGERV